MRVKITSSGENAISSANSDATGHPSLGATYSGSTTSVARPQAIIGQRSVSSDTPHACAWYQSRMPSGML